MNIVSQQPNLTKRFNLTYQTIHDSLPQLVIFSMNEGNIMEFDFTSFENSCYCIHKAGHKDLIYYPFTFLTNGVIILSDYWCGYLIYV